MNEKERFLVVAEKGLCCSLLCPQLASHTSRRRAWQFGFVVWVLFLWLFLVYILIYWFEIRFCAILVFVQGEWWIYFFLSIRLSNASSQRVRRGGPSFPGSQPWLLDISRLPEPGSGKRRKIHLNGLGLLAKDLSRFVLLAHSAPVQSRKRRQVGFSSWQQ